MFNDSYLVEPLNDKQCPHNVRYRLSKEGAEVDTGENIFKAIRKPKDIECLQGETARLSVNL